jgi:hypothetical protein
MFRDRSRYYGLSTETVPHPDGRTVTVVKLRRLPPTTGKEFTVLEKDRLDLLARTHLEDGTAFWRIADANSELQARRLEGPPGRVIDLPEP